MDATARAKSASADTVLPPRAKKQPVKSVWHGVELVDNYAWLRAENWQEVMRDPSVLPADIRAHLEAENAYTEAVMADTRELQEQLFQEMKGRIKEDDSSVPAPDGPWEYYDALCHGWAISVGLPPAARWRPRASASRRQQGGRGQVLLASRRRVSQLRPQAAGLCRRR
jgi:oligopeptidase B (EC:3.4.21.83). Serine peptidase. MEROPS family S09A